MNEDFGEGDAGKIVRVDQLSSTDVDDGPSQMDIDFNARIQDEQVLDELRMIQEESGKMNEHGLGICA